MSAAAATLIHDLAERGVRLSGCAGRLRVEAKPGVVTAEIRTMLAEHKSELLAALSIDQIRSALLRTANDEGVAPEHVHALTDAELAECEGLSRDTLRSYVLALRDSDLRKRGKCPTNETAPARCRMCGPVWLCPEVAALAPIVSGWPVVLGCPWCTNRAKGMPIPRPPVTCGNCRHFIRDAVNPDGGLGSCNAGHQFLSNEAMPFPNAQRQCQQFKPINTED